MTTYALESYNKEDGYKRYDIGTFEEMKNLLEKKVREDVLSDEPDNYFRIVSISDVDKEVWNKQAEELPELEVTDRLFGDWTQMAVASKYLGVTFGRVFNLTTDGTIRTSVNGRNKLVNVEDIVNRKIAAPRSGRPSFSSSENE